MKKYTFEVDIDDTVPDDKVWYESFSNGPGRNHEFSDLSSAIQTRAKYRYRINSDNYQRLMDILNGIQN